MDLDGEIEGVVYGVGIWELETLENEILLIAWSATRLSRDADKACIWTHFFNGLNYLYVRCTRIWKPTIVCQCRKIDRSFHINYLYLRCFYEFNFCKPRGLDRISLQSVLNVGQEIDT